MARRSPLSLHCSSSATSVQDRDGGVRLLDRAKMAMPSLALVWADATYSRQVIQFAVRALHLAGLIPGTLRSREWGS
jgi:hypothetical protein